MAKKKQETLTSEMEKERKKRIAKIEKERREGNAVIKQELEIWKNKKPKDVPGGETYRKQKIRELTSARSAANAKAKRELMELGKVFADRKPPERKPCSCANSDSDCNCAAEQADGLSTAGTQPYIISQSGSGLPTHITVNVNTTGSGGTHAVSTATNPDTQKPYANKFEAKLLEMESEMGRVINSYKKGTKI